MFLSFTTGSKHASLRRFRVGQPEARRIIVMKTLIRDHKPTGRLTNKEMHISKVGFHDVRCARFNPCKAWTFPSRMTCSMHGQCHRHAHEGLSTSISNSIVRASARHSSFESHTSLRCIKKRACSETCRGLTVYESWVFELALPYAALWHCWSYFHLIYRGECLADFDVRQYAK